MGLYRQIAGIPDGDPAYIEQVSGFAIFQPAVNYKSIPGTNTGITPVNYTTPIQTITPSNPIAVYDPWANLDPIDLGPSVLPPGTTTTVPIPPITTTPITQTLTPSQPLQPDPGKIPVPLPTVTQTSVKNNILPLLALAAIVVVAVKGDDLLHEKRKIALLGGLGLLYYGMIKNKLV